MRSASEAGSAWVPVQAWAGVVVYPVDGRVDAVGCTVTGPVEAVQLDVVAGRPHCSGRPQLEPEGDMRSRGALSVIFKIPECTSHLGIGLGFNRRVTLGNPGVIRPVQPQGLGQLEDVFLPPMSLQRLGDGRLVRLGYGVSQSRQFSGCHRQRTIYRTGAPLSRSVRSWLIFTAGLLPSADRL